LLLAVALAVYPVVRCDRLRPLVAVEGGVALVLLALALLTRSRSPVAWALFVFGTQYATSLLVNGGTVDAFAPLVGAGFFGLAELAGWAIEAGTVPDEHRVTVRRLVTVGLATLVAGGVGAILVTASELAVGGGVLLEGVGVAAAVASLALVAALAWRLGDAPRPFAR